MSLFDKINKESIEDEGLRSSSFKKNSSSGKMPNFGSYVFGGIIFLGILSCFHPKGANIYLDGLVHITNTDDLSK